MELQTKFIEGTDEQYSIREDGVVFKNYVIKTIKKEKNIIYKEKTQKKPFKNAINIQRYKISTSIKILIFNHFKYCICKKCNKKVDYLINKSACKECIKHAFKIHRKTYYDKNKEKLKNHIKEYQKNNVEKYTVSRKKSRAKLNEKGRIDTASQFLKLSSKDISNELLNEYRNLLKYKRELARKHNLHINTFR